MPRPLLLATLVILASGAAAQASIPRHAVRHHRLAHAGVRHWVVEMKDTGAAPAGAAQPKLAQTPRDSRLPTSVQQGLGRTGAVASLGFNHAGQTQGLERQEVDGAAEARFGHPDTVGGKVTIPF